MLERKLQQIAEKKNSLVNAFLYENKIDEATYEEQIDLLRQKAALAEMQLQDAKLEEFDVEDILEFANRVMSDLSRFWLQATLDQKIGLQKVLFPAGLKFNGDRTRVAAVKEKRPIVIQRNSAAWIALY